MEFRLCYAITPLLIYPLHIYRQTKYPNNFLNQLPQTEENCVLIKEKRSRKIAI